jgi:hypothetical protein
MKMPCGNERVISSGTHEYVNLKIILKYGFLSAVSSRIAHACKNLCCKLHQNVFSNKRKDNKKIPNNIAT